MQNAYRILGLQTDATSSEVKRRFRELAKKYHPDSISFEKDLDVTFNDIVDAYELISRVDKDELEEIKIFQRKRRHFQVSKLKPIENEAACEGRSAKWEVINQPSLGEAMKEFTHLSHIVASLMQS
ncbi:hypothetical protein PCE1_001434 [Barthelona sp. PCE]